MIKNYFLVALRNALRNKAYTFLNVFGLAIGIAVCFLIFLWVQDERAYDRFHEHADRIQRVLWDARFGDNEWTIPVVGVPVPEAMERELPEVERTVQVIQTSRTIRHEDDYLIENRFMLTQPAFFDVFSVRFLAGHPEAALDGPDAVVLTEETARRYFGDRDPLGKTLELNNGNLLRVTGVVEAFPRQSHLQFDFLAPVDAWAGYENRRDQWWSATVAAYALLRAGEDGKALEAKFNRYLAESVHTEPYGATGNYSRYLLQPLTDIHLRSSVDYGLGGGGNITYVYLFGLIGIFILGLAAINFVNLSTARSAARVKEVGIRKALGSQRAQLMRQFLAESFAFVAAALLLAVLFAELALPFLNDLSGKEISSDYFGSPASLLALLAIGLVIGLAAGIYPAVVISAFRPALAMRGKGGDASGRVWLRNGLVVAQFCISITLLVGTLVVREQLDFVQNTNLGFDKEHVLVVEGAGILAGRHHAFITRLGEHPSVIAATATQSLPGRSFDSTVFTPEQPSNYEQTSLSYAMVDEHYVDVLGLTIAEGRNFSPAFSRDSTAFLLNRSAAAALGWEHPVGRQMSVGGGPAGEVVGVVEDFHFESLHTAIQPLVLPFQRWTPSLVAVRLHPGSLREGIAAVQAVWNEFVPNRPFQYAFMDADLQRQYDAEANVASVFSVFAVLAVVIACLGLFGLAAYTAEQRTKEIGVRKVMGASVSGIIGLLSRDFARLVIIATVIAAPVAWFAMNLWLDGFAYRASVSVWVVVLAGTAALLIALLTVSSQAVKAALKNPVDALRWE